MEEDVNKSLEVLKNGGTIVYPTDTIWGIGCDATNPKAVEKVFQIKNRPSQKSFIILLNSIKYLNKYILEIPDVAEQLFSVADNPLTVVLPGAKNLAHNLIPEEGTIALRIPQDTFCQTLLSRFKKPIVSTSANRSGDSAPSVFSEINQQILKKVDYVVNWRRSETTPGQPSSIIKVGLNGEVEIIRD